MNLNFGYGPGHEVVRRFFLPLVERLRLLRDLCAARRLDIRAAGRCRAATRRLLDRWILSRLTRLVGEVARRAGRLRRAARAARAIEAFVDELSNWYVRRNRRRFWKGEVDADKRAAYATLYEVLTRCRRLLAPFVPFLAEAMWENLVLGRPGAPDSVHLADYPARARAPRPAIEAAIELGRRVVALGRTARAASGSRPGSRCARCG